MTSTQESETDTRQLILDSGERMFSDLCDKQLLDQAEQGTFAVDLWNQIVANGFHQLGTADSGTDMADMYAFIAQCGQFAVPVPIVETMLVNCWCGAGEGIFSIGLIVDDEIQQVPWGRKADKVVGIAPGQNEVRVVGEPTVVREEANLAGEPRDVIALPENAETLVLDHDPFAQLAVSRANLMAGSLQTLLDLGILFATERVQFGKPISKFQAIQHSLAIVAAEVAAAKRSADAAVDAFDGERFLPEVASAKARVGEAVTVAAEQIHQIHGAMGFTHEHRLHHFSRRAWAWRDEYGHEFYWQTQLGEHIAKLGPESAWGFIATRG